MLKLFDMPIKVVNDPANPNCHYYTAALNLMGDAYEYYGNALFFCKDFKPFGARTVPPICACKGRAMCDEVTTDKWHAFLAELWKEEATGSWVNGPKSTTQRSALLPPQLEPKRTTRAHGHCQQDSADG